MRTRAERRKINFKKALRKKNICEHCYGQTYYDNLHQYSKNKIHCSCPKCSAKTSKYGNTPCFTHANKIKIDSMNSQLEEM